MSRTRRSISSFVFFQFACLVPALALADIPKGNPTTDHPESNHGTLQSTAEAPKFGFSLGMGSQSATGNRGSLWQTSFAMYELKLHYWMTSHLALELGGSTASNSYDTTVSNLGHVDTSMVHIGLNAKYYFELQNIASSLGFMSPYVLIGGGSFTKTENSLAMQTQDSDSSMGVTVGAGLKFSVVPRRAFVELEAKLNSVSFKDTNTTRYSAIGLSDMSGQFFNVTGSFLVTL